MCYSLFCTTMEVLYLQSGFSTLLGALLLVPPAVPCRARALVVVV